MKVTVEATNGPVVIQIKDHADPANPVVQDIEMEDGERQEFELSPTQFFAVRPAAPPA